MLEDWIGPLMVLGLCMIVGVFITAGIYLMTREGPDILNTVIGSFLIAFGLLVAIFLFSLPLPEPDGSEIVAWYANNTALLGDGTLINVSEMETW